jgi:hypothetical protein
VFKIQINVGKPGGIVWKDVTAVRYETVEDAYTAKELWYPGASPRIVRVVEEVYVQQVSNEFKISIADGPTEPSITGASPHIVNVAEDITFAPPPPREPVYDENKPEDDIDEYDLDGWQPYTDVYEDGRSYA